MRQRIPNRLSMYREADLSRVNPITTGLLQDMQVGQGIWGFLYLRILTVVVAKGMCS
jgi:hypothetical protein